MGGSLIGYKYYLHTGTVNIGLMKEFFLWESVSTLIVFILLSILIFYLSRRLHKKMKRRLPYVGAAVLGLLLMALPAGVLQELYGIREMTSVKNTGFDEGLAKLKIPVSEYVKPESVKAEKGLSLIHI